jgi:hypothetical protein
MYLQNLDSLIEINITITGRPQENNRLKTRQVTLCPSNLTL